jgi:glycosyltransferase involved in cell wall biosynthesis
LLRGQIVLAAETEAMRQELARFSGLPVVLFPHPVQVQPLPAPAEQPRPVTITCPGFARYEKGADLLQQACRLVWTEPGFEHVHVVCQWPEPFALPDGRSLSPDSDLVADPRFELINDNLDAPAYEELLARTDLVVLPYRRESYYNRVSRVAIEAAIYGIPILPMDGTWAEEFSSLAGRYIPIKNETPESVALAITTAVENLQELKEHAQSFSHRAAAFHSAISFRKILCDLGIN